MTTCMAPRLTNAAIRRCKTKGIEFDDARAVVVEKPSGLELFATVYDAEARATKRRAQEHHPGRTVHVWTLKTLLKHETDAATPRP